MLSYPAPQLATVKPLQDGESKAPEKAKPSQGDASPVSGPSPKFKPRKDLGKPHCFATSSASSFVRAV